MLLQITLTFLLTLTYTFATPPPGYQKEEITTEKNPPKYNYGYTISDSKGSQEKQEQRDGIYAHGRYGVHAQDHHQTVEYLADDWGFHPFIEYSNQSPHSQSSTVIALGEEAVKALHTNQKTTTFLKSTTPLETNTNTVNQTPSPEHHQETVSTVNHLTSPTLQTIHEQEQQNLISTTQNLPNHQPLQNVIFITKPNQEQVVVQNDIKVDHRQGRILNVKNEVGKTENAAYLNEQAQVNPTENLILLNQQNADGYNGKLVLINHGNQEKQLSENQGGQENLVKNQEAGGQVVYINHGHEQLHSSERNNQEFFGNQNQFITHRPLLVQQNTHANLASTTLGGNQVYQHTTAQLAHGGDKVEQLFQGVAHLEMQVAKFAQNVEHLNNVKSEDEQTTENAKTQQRKQNVKIINAGQKNNNLQAIYYNYRDDEDPYPYAGSYGTKINPKFVQKSNVESSSTVKVNQDSSLHQKAATSYQRNHYRQNHNRFNQGQHLSKQTSGNHQQHLRKQTAFNQGQQLNKQTDFNQEQQIVYNQEQHLSKQTDFNQEQHLNKQTDFNQEHHLHKETDFHQEHQLSKQTVLNSNKQTKFNQYSSEQTNVDANQYSDDEKTLKLIENTKNLINSQDVLNINDILNAKVNDADSSNTQQVVSTTEASAVSLLKEPIVVGELDENNINEEEYSTTRTTSETKSTEYKSTVVTPRPVATTFLAPITAGVKLEEERSTSLSAQNTTVKTTDSSSEQAENEVRNNAASVVVDIQKSVPYYIGRFEYVQGSDGLVVDKQVDKEVANSVENENFGQQLLQYTVAAIPSPTQAGLVAQQEVGQNGQQVLLINTHEANAQVQHESLPTPEALIQHSTNTQTELSSSLTSSIHSSEEQQSHQTELENQHHTNIQLVESPPQSLIITQDHLTHTPSSSPYSSSYTINHASSESASRQEERVNNENAERYVNVIQQHETLSTPQTSSSSAYPTSSASTSSLVSSTSYQIQHGKSSENSIKASNAQELLTTQSLVTPVTNIQIPDVSTQENHEFTANQQVLIHESEDNKHSLNQVENESVQKVEDQQIQHQIQSSFQHNQVQEGLVLQQETSLNNQQANEEHTNTQFYVQEHAVPQHNVHVLIQPQQQILVQHQNQEEVSNKQQIQHNVQEKQTEHVLLLNQQQENHQQEIVVQNGLSQETQNNQAILVQNEFSQETQKNHNYELGQNQEEVTNKQQILIQQQEQQPQQIVLLNQQQVLQENQQIDVNHQQHENHQQYILVQNVLSKETQNNHNYAFEKSQEETNKQQIVLQQHNLQEKQPQHVLLLNQQQENQHQQTAINHQQELVQNAISQETHHNYALGQSPEEVRNKQQVLVQQVNVQEKQPEQVLLLNQQQVIQHQQSGVQQEIQQQHNANYAFEQDQNQLKHILLQNHEQAQKQQTVVQEQQNQGQILLLPTPTVFIQKSNLRLLANKEEPLFLVPTPHALPQTNPPEHIVIEPLPTPQALVQHQIQRENNIQSIQHDQRLEEGQLDYRVHQLIPQQEKFQQTVNPQFTVFPQQHEAAKNVLVPQQHVLKHEQNLQQEGVVSQYNQHIIHNQNSANHDSASHVHVIYKGASQTPGIQHQQTGDLKSQQVVINGQQDMLNGQQHVYNGQQDVLNGQQNVFNGQQDVLNGQQGVLNGHQETVKTTNYLSGQSNSQQVYKQPHQSVQKMTNFESQRLYPVIVDYRTESKQNQAAHYQAHSAHKHVQTNSNGASEFYEHLQKLTPHLIDEEHAKAVKEVKEPQQIYLQEINYPQELVHVTLPGYDPKKLVTQINVQLPEEGEKSSDIQQQQVNVDNSQVRYQQEVQSQHQQQNIEIAQNANSQKIQQDLQIDSSQEVHTNTANSINKEAAKVETIIEKKIPVPYVVEVPKPYPVQVTKLVPQPYPVTVTQTVKVPIPTPVEVKVPHPVPVEVPKYIDRPYPVYVNEKEAHKALYDNLRNQNVYANVNGNSKPQMYAPSFDGFNSYVPKGSNFYHTIHYNDYIGLTPPKFKTKSYHTISTQAYQSDKNVASGSSTQSYQSEVKLQQQSPSQNYAGNQKQTGTTLVPTTYNHQFGSLAQYQGVSPAHNQHAYSLVHTPQNHHGSALVHTTNYQGSSLGPNIHNHHAASSTQNHQSTSSAHSTQTHQSSSLIHSTQSHQSSSLIHPTQSHQSSSLIHSTQHHQSPSIHSTQNHQSSSSIHSAQKHQSSSSIHSTQNQQPTRPYTLKHFHRDEKISPTQSYPLKLSTSSVTNHDTLPTASSLNHQSPYVSYTFSQKHQTPPQPQFQYNYARRYRNARHSFDNLRLEYGFKPPLIPSLEIDENGKPVEKIEDN